LSADSPQRRFWRESPVPTGESPAGGGRRRLLVRLGIAVLLITILVLVPGYIATRSQFLGRYSNLKSAKDTWSTSVHSQASCQSCHVSPTWTAQTIYAGRMVGEFYLSLVLRTRQPNLFGAPTNEACARCHIDLRTVSPSGDLNIPHRAHVNVLKLKCVQCHKYLVHETNPAGKHTPSMATCLTCHDGKTAKNNCSACHTNKALPENHKSPDWVIIHPNMQKEIDCAKCHKWTNDWCAQCHATRPRSHTKMWRTDHAKKVKTHRNCEVCHDAPFCTRCHGDVPKLNFNPALKRVQ